MPIKVGTLLRAATAAVAICAGAAAARADTFVNVLTGGTSGVYYPMGVAIAKIFTDKLPGARPSVQATKASVENLNLLQQGKGELAFTLGDSLAFAWAGDEEAGFKAKLTKLRGLAAIYPNHIQIVAAKDSGVTASCSKPWLPSARSGRRTCRSPRASGSLSSTAGTRKRWPNPSSSPSPCARPAWTCSASAWVSPP